MINLIKRYILGAKSNTFPFKKYGFFGERINDPIYNCDVYLSEGCSHVDGFLCDMKTCSTLNAVKRR